MSAETKEVSDRIDQLIDQLPQGRTARALGAVRRHPYIALGFAVALFYLVLVFGPAFFLGIRESFSNRAIEKTKVEAAAEKNASDQEKINAGQFEIERKAEDLNREQVLKPKREEAAANLAEATRRRKAAEELYEKNRNARRLPDPNDLNFRRRNCSDLAELYPGERFAGCQ